MTVGPVRVTAVLDATGPFFTPLADAFPGATPELREAAERLDPGPSAPDGEWWLAFRAYVVEVGDRVVLVDTGAASDTALRPSWAPGPDTHLVRRIADQAGVLAADVTDVVLTHLHADHAAGSVDGSGAPAFPNATYLVQDADLAALGPGTLLRTGLVEPLLGAGQLRGCAGEVELASAGGVSARLVPTPGHTPGHQSLVIAADDDLVVLAGDVFLHELQVIEPGRPYAHDADPALAERTRIGLLDRLAEHGGRLGTAHLRAPYLEVEARR
ncbi:MBL fold metallo-hydrolase [Nocardioides sp. T2.26MG-1]|uniref:MBL fold metallo-hydrolase n=1 Tax=Nocardioides sp. T2.26MG-1 TaxID=3041166 RepID=UPI00253F8859|nr:MBL fold metallo-hydrolase [Nocardioides sp. T2.26MG-1]